RHDPDAVDGQGGTDPVGLDAERLAPHAQHLTHRGPVQVRIEHADRQASPAERPREIRGDRALPDAALPRDDRHGRADGRHPGGEARLLGDDLLDDLRAAVPGDVAIALHVSAASYPPARPGWTDAASCLA